MSQKFWYVVQWKESNQYSLVHCDDILDKNILFETNVYGKIQFGKEVLVGKTVASFNKRMDGKKKIDKLAIENKQKQEDKELCSNEFCSTLVLEMSNLKKTIEEMDKRQRQMKENFNERMDKVEVFLKKLESKLDASVRNAEHPRSKEALNDPQESNVSVMYVLRYEYK